MRISQTTSASTPTVVWKMKLVLDNAGRCARIAARGQYEMSVSCGVIEYNVGLFLISSSDVVLQWFVRHSHVIRKLFTFVDCSKSSPLIDRSNSINRPVGWLSGWVVGWLVDWLTGPEPKPEFKGDTRTYRVQLDCNQYQKDMMDIVKGHEVSHAQIDFLPSSTHILSS